MLMRFKVAVSNGSILVSSTTFGQDRGANGAADEGSKTLGILVLLSFVQSSEVRQPRKKQFISVFTRCGGKFFKVKI